MMLVEVDIWPSQTTETRFQLFREILDTKTKPRRELGCDQHVSARCQLTETPLRGSPAVHGGGIEQVDPRVQADLQSPFLFFVSMGAAVGDLGRMETGEALWLPPGHGPHPEAGNAQAAVTQGRSVVHCLTVNPKTTSFVCGIRS